MGKEFREKLEKVFDVLGEIVAFVAAVVWALVIVNLTFDFLPPVVVAIFDIAKSWLLLVLVGIVGLEATIKRNFIIRLLFYIVLAVLIIFHCFPDTYRSIIDVVQQAA